MEVETQTGSSDAEIEVEAPEIIELEDPVKMESTDPFYYDSVPDTVPRADSFDNGKFMCAISRSSYGFPTLFACSGKSSGGVTVSPS